MLFRETALPEIVLVEPEFAEDERGGFARIFSREEFLARGLDTFVEQCSISTNRQRRTLRGLHFQEGPDAEAKLVRCTAGRLFDVAVDVREDSPTYLRWVGVELSAANRLSVVIPRGFAHGFLTLEDDTEVLYQISVPYRPATARGIRWDDPQLGISWPDEPEVVSQRDASFALLDSQL